MVNHMCCVPLCNNTNNKHCTAGNYYDGKYCTFPKDMERRQLWVKSLDLPFEPKQKDVVCSEHFREEDWRKQDVFLNVPLANRKLNPNAVPTLKKIEIILENMLDDKREVKPVMSEEERKRLVADAIADYEKQNEKEQYNQYYREAKRKRSRYDVLLEELSDHQVERNNSYSFIDDEDIKTTIIDDISYEEDSDASLAEEVEMSLEELNGGQNKIFRKCAEVFMDVEDLIFQINCLFCEDTLKDMVEFVEHIKEQHIHTGEMSEDGFEDGSVKEQEEKIYISSNYIKPNIKVEKSEITSENIDLDDYSFIRKVICLWRRNKVLWDRSHLRYNRYKDTVTMLDDIIKNIKQLPMEKTIGPITLQILLDKLTQGYLKDYARCMALPENKRPSYKPKNWFFADLAFLRQHARNDFAEKVASELPIQINPIEKEAFLMDIIELYESYPSLWNVHDANYKGKLQNEEAFKSLFEEVKNMQAPDFELVQTESQLFTLLSCLHKWFMANEFLDQKAALKAAQGWKFSCRFPGIYDALNFLQNQFPPIRCSLCDQSFSTEQSYLKHRNKTTNTCSNIVKGKIFVCQYCNKCFAKEAALTAHVRQHTDERPYACKVCGQRFRNYPTWYRHRRVHTKNKPFICEICNKSYYCQGHLNLHKICHQNVRDKVCDICGKGFTLAKYLYRHRNNHCREKSFNCHYCDNIFTTKSSLYHHMSKCRIKAFANDDNDVVEVVDSPAPPPSNQVRTITSIGSVVPMDMVTTSTKDPPTIIVRDNIIIKNTSYASL